MRQSQLRWQWPQARRGDIPPPVYRPWRWRTNIKLHYRTLDLEGPYDADDFYKAEVTAGAVFEFISPDEARRAKYAQRARARAEAIVAQIDHYRWMSAARKRLQRAEREFDFVFEPYRQQLQKKYGQWWQAEVEMRSKAAAVRVRLEMQRLTKLAIGAELNRITAATPNETFYQRATGEPPCTRKTDFINPAVVGEIRAGVTALGIEAGVKWQALERDGAPYMKLFFPEETVLQFVADPHGEIGRRLDRRGIDWNCVKAADTHWLWIVFSASELLSWLRRGTPKL